MSHPVGLYISKSQDHELNHWLRKNNYRQTENNRALLCNLIDAAKEYYGMDSNDHLLHKELDLFPRLNILYPFESQ